MLNQLLFQPLAYSGAAIVLIGLAIYLSPNSYLKKYLLAKASENGQAGIYFPLLSSILVSFTLTVIFKLLQIN